MSKFSGVWERSIVITEHGNNLTVIERNRPWATGIRHSETTATVNFPEEGEIYEATLVNDDLIQWSNNTTWRKTGDSQPLYSITTYTGNGSNDGTDSPVFVTLYDSVGKRIGGEFPLNGRRHGGGVQTEQHTPPLWGHIEKDGFPLPAVIKVRIGGGDFWNCQKITVKRFNDPKGRNDLTAVFQIGLGFSTDGGEGRAQVFVKNSNFKITETFLEEKIQTASTFVVVNNQGDKIGRPPTSATVKQIDSQTVSNEEAKGNEETNSLKVGIKRSGGFDYKGVSADAEISVEYQRTWKEWSSTSNTRAYTGIQEQALTIEASDIPANTVRIYRWDSPYRMRTIRMENGLAEPTDFNVVLDQSITISSVHIIDINANQKITRLEWYLLKSGILNSKSGIPTDVLERAEQTIIKNGWFVDGIPFPHHNSLDSVLVGGGWRNQSDLATMSDEDKRNTVIVGLDLASADNIPYISSLDNNELIGSAALYIWLRDKKIRTKEDLSKMTLEHQRNTVAVAINVRSNSSISIPDLQAMNNNQIAELLVWF
ncbi:MAG: hypothetical protein F6K26_03865 [Moorea sp. SIO2I5]|nr:hypothetical protein [Moorena sp. SIO2I5]